MIIAKTETALPVIVKESNLKMICHNHVLKKMRLVSL